MRIRATILTPVLAVFTVAALVSTGIVIDYASRGDARATLLGSMPEFAAAPAPAPAALTDAGLTADIVPEPVVASQSSGSSSTKSSREHSEYESDDDEYEAEEPEDD